MADSPSRPGPGPGPGLNLETELTCSICTDLLYNPLTLLDCLHTFCGACLKEWFRFQAARAESAPGPPPPPETAIFTCPSCRDRVRDTKHDPRVTTLLEMFLALNPDKGKSADEKKEMDGRYRKGERVMPRLRFMERTEEQRRLDEQERRLLEEVQRMSLREATETAVARGSGGRNSRERSRVRAPDSRPRAQSAALRGVESVAADGGRRRRSESGQRSAREQVAEARVRQVEHQSSLRSLISSSGGLDSRDIEREIEDFARQIQEEGLLDGLDLDNLDLENNDELSRKITEAYRRRHRERSRRDGGRRSNASAQSHRSDVAARPRSRTGEVSRPTSRHTVHSRAPSASSSEERGRYPPSSSALLEVQDPSRRRRTQSGGRSATVPIPPTQPDASRVGARSQTDLPLRSGAGDSQFVRPSTGIDARSSSSPTTGTASASRQESPDFASTSGPLSPGLTSHPLPSTRRARVPLYKEPLINCSTCSKEHIEYELHFNCSFCHNGEWNICLDCWRRRKGCLHWFGFGQAAWDKWEKHNLNGPPTSPPHVLTANRYLPPKTIPGGAEGRRTLTTENPLDRLQSGAFCCRCSTWANDCYWHCEVCNEGEWGFCNDCVNQGQCCSHPLLALAYRPPPSSSLESNHHAQTETPPSSPALPPTRNPPMTTANFSPIGSFQPLTPTVPCEICRSRIPPSDSHYHCYSCPSKLLPSDSQPQPGGYNLCFPCYNTLVSDGAIAPENGPGGWRRCAQGHRMVVVGYITDRKDHRRRKVAREQVGGRRLKIKPREGGAQVCSWVDGHQKRMEKLMTVDVSMSTDGLGLDNNRGQGFAEGFPPDGGTRMKAAAGWGWIPDAGVGDELMFPKGAEIMEVEDVNGEWFHGYYMGSQGLFPAPYVRVIGGR
ncbi:E3 ubiquitin-protein ligase CHFR [Madurella mycetomatis]|uniref:E3 ubiquitin-protein ligase CHFR n=1 Tax=Madurella mycetomatis TaxID=100816 RepID=A0A175WBM9_9PEZI|nr:E3 ubiquitin-protein ligase CHFR [Madurella mycetomatis]KXX81117.1 E3 ubiquitin-protein ligase CHFR [Madurella mycetomatis]